MVFYIDSLRSSVLESVVGSEGCGVAGFFEYVVGGLGGFFVVLKMFLSFEK